VLAVDASVFDRARAERFAQLLDEAGGGRRHHTRTRVDDELAELVSAAQLLRDVRLRAAPEPIFKRDLRALLIAKAERDGIGATSIAAERENARLARPRARGAIAIGIAAGTLALSGVSVASSDALPGDALYGMKRSSKRAQLALAGSDFVRGQLYLEFARSRVHDANALRGDQSNFVSVLTEMDADTQQGVRVLVTTALNKHDTAALDAIDGFVVSQRTQVASMLHSSDGPSREKVRGSLALLTAVEDRATAARSALACGANPTGSDPLGPIVSCPASAADQPNTGEQPGKKPAKGTGLSHGNTHALLAAEVEAAKVDDALGELGRILAALLGG
jgi:hypothetical protein